GLAATTNPSVPVPRIGTLPLAGPPPPGSPLASQHRFPRSAQEPVIGIAPPRYRLPPGQSAGFRRAWSQRKVAPLVSTTSRMAFDTSSAVHSRSPSRYTPDGFSPAFPSTLTTPAVILERLVAV